MQLRIEKKKLYIKKMTELQRLWQNPAPDGDWSYVDVWTDEEIDKQLKDTIGQVDFQWMLIVIKWIFLLVIGSFIILGVVGLLVFGIKQLF